MQSADVSFCSRPHTIRVFITTSELWLSMLL